MNINDRLKESFKNVAYSADKTWYNNFSSYQNANVGLYVRERRFLQETTKPGALKPRTVKDCIPTSKLAKYGNYEYGDSREMSYSQSVMQFERLSEKFSEEPTKEPWMLEDVDDLYIGFLNYKDNPNDTLHYHEDKDNVQDNKPERFEALFLQANSFDEMDLKFKIAGSKKLWEGSSYPFYWYQPMVVDKNLALFKSPTGGYFVKSEDDCSEKYKHFTWFKNVPESENTFAHLKALSKSFEEQNTWIIKKDHLNWMSTPRHHQDQDHVDMSTNKRLYSAVLQGTSSSKSNVILFKNDLRSDSSNILGPIPSSLNATLDGDASPVTSLLFGPGVSGKYLPSALHQDSTPLAPVLPPHHHLKKTSVGSSTMHFSNVGSGGGVYNAPVPLNGVPVQTTPSSLTPIVSSCSYAATAATQSPSYGAGGYQQYYHHNNSFLNSRLYTGNILPNTAAASNALQAARHNFIHNSFNFPASSFAAPPMIPNAMCGIPPYHHASSMSYQRAAPTIAVPSMYSRNAGMNPQRPLQIHAAPVVVPNSNWFIPNQQMQYFSDKFRRYRANPPSTSTNSNSVFQYKQNNIVNSTTGRILHEVVPQANRLLDCANIKTGKKCLVPPLRRGSAINVNNSVSTNTIESTVPLLPEEGTGAGTNKDFERVVTKTVNVVLEDSDTFVPVNTSNSEELEMQALEQYNSSSDNVYQELERLATEQYDENTIHCAPENWKNPPNHDNRIFGGLVAEHTAVCFNKLTITKLICVD